MSKARCIPLVFLTSVSLVGFGASAEDFDFDGSASIRCFCPSPTSADQCGLVGRVDVQLQAISIKVHKLLSVDLSEICFRHRDKGLCCDTPRSSYRGDVTKKCPGRSDC